MNPKLLHSCVGAWLLGLLGMSVSRGLFDLGPGALPFDIAARFWIVGGLGYLFLGLVACASEHQRSHETDSVAEAQVDRVHELNVAAEDHALRVRLASNER